MKKVVCMLLVFLIFSCEKEKTMQLAEVETVSITESESGIPVYMFYDTSEPDGIRFKPKDPSPAEKHRAFYIDKRLLLKHIIPRLKKFKAEREKPDSYESAKNYVAVTGKDVKKVSFVDFSGVMYLDNDQFSKFYIKDFPEQHMQLLTLTLNFKANNEITVDGNPVERAELVPFLKEYIGFVSEGKNTLIYLNFNEELTFRQYISDYDLIMNMSSSVIKIAETQFIYNEDLLPDCNCEL